MSDDILVSIDGGDITVDWRIALIAGGLLLVRWLIRR